MNSDNIINNTVAIIPCLNEQRFVADVINTAIKYVAKVIVVDDGSTDATAEVARQAGAEVISHPGRQGAGAATRTGFKAALAAGAALVVTLDGDGQHNADEIPDIAKPVLDGRCDLAIGSRFLCKTDAPRLRKFGIDVITWLYNFGHNNKIVDGQSGFRAYSRKALQAIDITYAGFGFSIQSLVQVRKQGMKIIEVPISCIYHEAGSTEHPLRHGIAVACDVIKIRMQEELFKSGRKAGQ